MTKYCTRVLNRYGHSDGAVARGNWSILSTFEVQNKTQNIKTEICDAQHTYIIIPSVGRGGCGVTFRSPSR